ncbi:MAG: FixH family protein, partial [Gammaproteobacteria bacterium]
KYFWPWFFIGVPLFTVIGGIHLLFVAMHNPDGLVVDDYYKHGLAINRTLEKDRRAVALGVGAEGRFAFEQKLLTLQLTGLSEWPATLTLSLLHPTQAQRDQVITLQKQSGTGEYFGVVSGIAAGDWHMILEPPQRDWRLATRFLWPGAAAWRMTATDK